MTPGAPGRSSRRRLSPRRVVVLLLALALIAGALASWTLRDDLRRLVWYADKVGWSSTRIALFRPEREIRLERADGVVLRASLWGVGTAATGPAIVLLHGNTPEGSELGFYRLLGARLAEHGFRVVAPDLAGFGGSGDPFATGSPDSLDPARDAQTALDYVATSEGIDLARIYLLAHSGGSVGALAVGTGDPRVRAIALIGPPRRVAERLADPSQVDYFYERARKTRLEVLGEDFPGWYTRDVWLEDALGNGACTSLIADMARQLPYFSEPGHKPLLLIDGERESPEDRGYLERYYQAIAEPKSYVTVSGSDHYANTDGWLGFVLYDAPVAERTLQAILDWIRGIETDPGRPPAAG